MFTVLAIIFTLIGYFLFTRQPKGRSLAEEVYNPVFTRWNSLGGYFLLIAAVLWFVVVWALAWRLLAWLWVHAP